MRIRIVDMNDGNDNDIQKIEVNKVPDRIRNGPSQLVGKQNAGHEVS